jgi:CO/xanthine dehydrogenase FAD-binding subunit
VRTFDYARPSTVPEAVDLLARHRGAARVLAGGTDLVVGLRQHTVTPRLVVDVKGLEDLQPGVTGTGDAVVIGATAVMADLARDPLVRRHFPALVEAMDVVGSIQIRNRATLAGNVCNASPAADTVPPMLAHDAHVHVSGPTGARRLALRDVILGPGRTALEPGDVVTAVELGIPRQPAGVAFARMTRRRGVDLASVSVCCSVGADGVTRFAYGAVAPRPFLVADDTGTLADPEAGEDRKAAVLEQLIANASPISDVRASREYRVAMLRVLSRRALATSTDRLARALAARGRAGGQDR